MKKLTVDEYIKALEKMKRSSKDRVGTLGEVGLTGIGTAAGLAVSGTIATAVGASTFLGSSTLASIVGGVFVTTTPVGWVLGAAVAGGSLAYAATKLVQNGSKYDSLKDLSMRELEQRINQMRAKASFSHDANEKMRSLISGFQYLVANNVISQEKSTKFLSAVEKKHYSVDDAFGLMSELLSQHNLSLPHS